MAESSEQTQFNVPLLHASLIELQVTSNDWTFFLGQIVPRPGEKLPDVKPTCILQVSPQTAKDLYLIIKGSLEKYEEQYGTIETDFSRSLEEGKE